MEYRILRKKVHQPYVGQEEKTRNFIQKIKDKSPGGESNTRSPDSRHFNLQSGALNQLGYREELALFEKYCDLVNGAQN